MLITFNLGRRVLYTKTPKLSRKRLFHRHDGVRHRSLGECSRLVCFSREVNHTVVECPFLADTHALIISIWPWEPCTKTTVYSSWIIWLGVTQETATPSRNPDVRANAGSLNWNSALRTVHAIKPQLLVLFLGGFDSVHSDMLYGERAVEGSGFRFWFCLIIILALCALSRGWGQEWFYSKAFRFLGDSENVWPDLVEISSDLVLVFSSR